MTPLIIRTPADWKRALAIRTAERRRTEAQIAQLERQPQLDPSTQASTLASLRSQRLAQQREIDRLRHSRP